MFNYMFFVFPVDDTYENSEKNRSQSNILEKSTTRFAKVLVCFNVVYNPTNEVAASPKRERSTSDVHKDDVNDCGQVFRQGPVETQKTEAGIDANTAEFNNSTCSDSDIKDDYSPLSSADEDEDNSFCSGSYNFSLYVFYTCVHNCSRCVDN